MSLSELSLMIRKAVPFVVLGGLVVLILIVILRIVILLSSSRPAPIVAFAGKPLPRMTLSREVVPVPAGLALELDTLSGVPEVASSSASVYFIPEKAPSFGANEQAILFSRTLGFDDTARTQLSGVDRIFVDRIRRLVVDLTTFQYTFTREIDTQLQDMITGAKLKSYPTLDSVEQDAVAYIQKTGIYPQALARGRRIVTLYRYDVATGQGTVVTTPAEANMYEVGFLPADIDGAQVHTPLYYSSSNYLVFFADGKSLYPVKAQIKHYEISETLTTVEYPRTYPFRTPREAWDDLLAGRAILGSGAQTTRLGKLIKIKQMYIGYIMPEIYSTHLYPYYIFVDNADFAAYVPAIAEVYLQPQTSISPPGPIPTLPDLDAPAATDTPTPEPTLEVVPTVEEAPPVVDVSPPPGDDEIIPDGGDVIE